MAQYEEFTIDQGSDVALELHLVNHDGSIKNLAGHSVTGKIKKTYGSSDSDATSFNSIIADYNGGIVTLELSNSQTDSLKAGRYVYDVEITFYDSDQNAIVERVLEGKITVTPSVTK